MDYYKLVLPEHLNHYGNLFGGYLLMWIDEFAYITANLEFPDHQFVTIALDNVEFRQGVNNGEILKFSITRDRVGQTSVKYHVRVFGIRHRHQTDTILFETNITYVSINSERQKQPIKKRSKPLRSL
jgi:acyl-CoA hydrolase